jgi:hypothetical protein
MKKNVMLMENDVIFMGIRDVIETTLLVTKKRIRDLHPD